MNITELVAALESTEKLKTNDEGQAVPGQSRAPFLTVGE
jgi:hypothetical protein